MSSEPPLFWCLGGVVIDHIGRAESYVQRRQSNPGAARLRAGGVALNIARALAGHGAEVALVAAVGRDIGADMIVAELARAGVEDRLIRTSFSTGAYLAIEDADGDLFAGVSDLSALEALPAEIIAAQLDQAPSEARLVIDANLAPEQLQAAAARSGWLAAEAVSAPKAPRLAPILPRLNAFFCNLSEAAALGVEAKDAQAAALLLAVQTSGAVFVTNGAASAAVALGDSAWTRLPPSAPAASVTGAGDAFTAAAIMALAADASPEEALSAAINAAAAHLGAP